MRRLIFILWLSSAAGGLAHVPVKSDSFPRLQIAIGALGRITNETRVPLLATNAPQTLTASFGYNGDNQFGGNYAPALHTLDGEQRLVPEGEGGLVACAWDARGRLVAAVHGNDLFTCGYDPAGRRHWTALNGQTNRWVYGPDGRVLMRVRPDGGTNLYVHGLGLLYEVELSTGAAKHYHYDQRGSTVALTDENGKLTDRVEYSVWGKRMFRSGKTETPFLWHGRFGVQTDPTGLIKMGMRWYTPVLGRFLSEDPAGIEGGVNLYAFAGGDPVNFIDPSGFGPRSVAVSWLEDAAGGFLVDGAWGTVSGIWYAATHPGETASGLWYAGTHLDETVEAIWAGAREFSNRVGSGDPRAIGLGTFEVVAALVPVSKVSKLRYAAKTIDPAAVRFSQSSISRNFSAGGSVDDLAAGLRSGTVKAGDVPAIRLVEKDGNLFSLDNRRLEAFRRAETPIPYRMATPEEAAAEAWKFTTKNNGTSIRVRGE